MSKRYKELPSSEVRVLSFRTARTARTKFVPQYDSSIPLNPWSKVSMSGYMVARVKKTLPKIIDKIMAKMLKIVEKLD